MFDARNSGEIHTAFAELVRVIKADATITAIDPVLLDCHEQIAVLAVRHSLPAARTARPARGL